MEWSGKHLLPLHLLQSVRTLAQLRSQNHFRFKVLGLATQGLILSKIKIISGSIIYTCAASDNENASGDCLTKYDGDNAIDPICNSKSKNGSQTPKR